MNERLVPAPGLVGSEYRHRRDWARNLQDGGRSSYERTDAEIEKRPAAE
jgi:hypothetical protein